MDSGDDILTKIINEEINLFEAEISGHADDRLRGRLTKMVNNTDITTNEATTIENNVKRIVSTGFNPDKSYGILLGKFNINPNSMLVTDKHKSGTYYEINSLDSQDIVKDSTGNEFWGIVRNNRLITVFLRKSIQRKTANQPREMGGLGVDIIIDDFPKFIDAREQQKQVQQQSQLNKQKELENRINISGVWWEIDNTRQIVYKKNNPNSFVKFDDVLDYPEWDEATKEKILNFVSE